MTDYQDILSLKREKFGEVFLNTASIGGSGTFSIDTAGRGFPEVLSCAGPKTVVRVFRDVSTPFGDVPIVKLIDVDGFPVIRVPYHGWRLPEATLENTLATFWLLYKLDVEQIVVDASVGGIRAKPWDFVVPSDVIINSRAKEAVARLARELGRDPWVRMASPFCPRIREALITNAKCIKEEGTEEPTHPIGDVIDGGTTITTPLSVFETAVEIRFYRDAIPDAVIVNQSTGQEAAVSRILGMCMAVINPVANYAEGIDGGAWLPDEGGMKQFYWDIALPTAIITYRALREIVNKPRSCGCQHLSREVNLSVFTHPGH